jgi:serine/threonine protein kinase
MIGQLLDGRYKVVRELGAGGFAQTYIAEDVRLYNCQCVVKQLKLLESDPFTLQVAKRLFEAETKTLHKLGSHNQIPQLLAHFEENQEFYLVQEFVDGQSLDREIIPGMQLSESYAIALLQDILEPLSFVHQQNVIHRDIKPSNLIRRSSDNKIVLIDFGAVKQVAVTKVTNEQGTTKLTVAIGTSGYMPSEQSRGIPRLSSDIYAVGMTAIQSLTGMSPDELTEDIQTAEIRWRDRIQISQGLAKILEKMVSYDFRQRYSSAIDALQAIQQMQANDLNFPSTQPAIISTAYSPTLRLDSPPTPKRSTLPLIIGLTSLLGIILAITAPSFFNDRPRAKQSEAQTYVGTLNKGQQAYFTEKLSFSNNIEALGIGIQSETGNYLYRTTPIDRYAVQSVGVAKREGFKSYTGVVWITTDTNNGQTLSILCESIQPTTQNPPILQLPKLPSNSTTGVSCPSGYLPVGR